jgi:3-oxoacyl-[acyl-carrier protein] reductase
MASLTGKVAIVTGGGRGIGRAISERLAQDGASIVVNYAKSAEGAKEVVSAIEGGAVVWHLLSHRYKVRAMT